MHPLRPFRRKPPWSPPWYAPGLSWPRPSRAAAAPSPGCGEGGWTPGRNEDPVLGDLRAALVGLPVGLRGAAGPPRRPLPGAGGPGPDRLAGQEAAQVLGQLLGAGVALARLLF